MPHAEDAERCVLGAVLIDNGLMSDVAEALTEDAFYFPTHRRVYKAMLDLYLRSEPIDPILIGAEIKKSGFHNIEVATHITQLTHGLPPFKSLDQHIRLINDNAKLRDLIKLCGQLSADAMNAVYGVGAPS